MAIGTKAVSAIALATAGIAVCAADVRGVGDLEPQFSGGAAHYERPHQTEEDYAWASLILGRSLLGQRAADIIGVAQALGQKYPQASIVLAAHDKMTVPALCAAALEPRISKTYLSRHLVSWRSVVETETYSCPWRISRRVRWRSPTCRKSRAPFLPAR